MANKNNDRRADNFGEWQHDGQDSPCEGVNYDSNTNPVRRRARTLAPPSA